MANSSPTGRYTPKKVPGSTPTPSSTPPDTGTVADPPAYRVSGRYTPPTPKEFKQSPRWVPILMFTLLVLGLLVIICNYMSLLPGDASNWYLLLGLALITGGFITATQLH